MQRRRRAVIGKGMPMDTKDWGTFDTQLGKVRDAVSELTADLGPSPKMADVRERGRALDIGEHLLGAGSTARHKHRSVLFFTLIAASTNHNLFSPYADARIY